MTTVNDLITRFEEFAPLSLAEPHDPTGFQIGSKDQKIKNVMTTLDVRPEVVEEAINRDVDFIFAHHPVMFHPARNLDLADPQNQMYANLLEHHITVYAAHTNLDNANGGMNDWLADAIGLHNPTGLVPHLDSNGNPTNYSMGRFGNLKRPMKVIDLGRLCKQVFGINGLRMVTNDDQQNVSRVAILGGDGGKFYPEAIKRGVQVYITGDLYYHTSQEMLSNGLSAIDPGHHIESICKNKLAEMFTRWSDENNWKINVFASQLNTDPFEFI
ncbi:Nif3-like dinuclear metal center hexameric protein [Fructilactobacillus fructivorans]|uniref:GTP cyclohydrolase 1 type 2 homolog n=1 Tax=Fructilactobacillus fructivorans TaxID=1614 RepID=A0A0C1PP93_9LACO|nr:Nif3-like dinuclear metal center hexameric protein [Fructilactobacillus fructivorans]KID42612.1 hypothetical protein LfDm3_0064 [Fructilactobacillus fructivorans]MCT0151838.1 Nif3-like dinuclear metal center hexameric protein [Fructilactobacillus fructivorans]MCT2868033.1 Nif3-like dinuclear metal center hexameric protein [Fructilactobacillus fructivorans]MCT2868685.1 Nif3-like dinuclear metal center hexameric protein [Fructilactobacillus fructivorans]MCT2873384.1 Nif3-like dinuclear metal 